MNKILFLNLYDDPATAGGVEMTLHHLSQGLLRRGLEPVVLATAPTPGLHRIERHGVRIWCAGQRNLYWPSMKKRRNPAARMLWHGLDSYNVAMQPPLRRVLEIERPDVVSAHNLPGWSSAAWATIADMGIPAVQVLHDSYAICPKTTMYKQSGNCSRQCLGCRLLRLPHRRLSNRVSAVVGVSRFILDRHLEHGYFRDGPIQRVIHNTRDPEELGVDTVRAREPDGMLRFGFIGRLDPTKGIEPLLQAFSAAALPDTELWIAGSGEADYERTLRAGYASGTVRFLGRTEPSDFYSQVDVVVVPSLWHDTFPGVVLEALAFGKPVIGARRGGIPEMIRHGENGLLFEPDRPGDLIGALQRLARSASLRARLGQAAWASGRPFLDREAWVQRYVELYAQIADQPLPGSASSARLEQPLDSADP